MIEADLHTCEVAMAAKTAWVIAEIPGTGAWSRAVNASLMICMDVLLAVGFDDPRPPKGMSSDECEARDTVPGSTAADVELTLDFNEDEDDFFLTPPC